MMLSLTRNVRRTLLFIALLNIFLATAVVNIARAEDAPVAVEKVRAFRDGDVFTAELQTTAAWIGADVHVQYFKDSIQVDIPGTFLNKGKQLIKVEDRAFKSVYATQYDATTVRARFTMKPGLTAKSFAGRFHAKHAPSSMTFEISGDAQEAKGFAQKVSDEVNKIAVNDESATDAMPAKLVAGAAAAAKTVEAKVEAKTDDIAAALAVAKTAAAEANSESNPVAPAAEAKKLDTSKLSEKEIPVLATVSKEKKSESNPMFRLLMTLAVVAAALGAAAFGVKKYAARQGKTPNKTRINVLTNHHLGPKKNLMIVQVAGETLLLGVTDHNITMLKTLALIDDEVPAHLPQRFNESMDDFLGDDQADDQDSFASQGLDQIRDTVSSRLKNLRNL